MNDKLIDVLKYYLGTDVKVTFELPGKNIEGTLYGLSHSRNRDCQVVIKVSEDEYRTIELKDGTKALTLHLRPLGELTEMEWGVVFNAGFSDLKVPVIIEEWYYELSAYDAEFFITDNITSKLLHSLSYTFEERAFTCNGVRFNQLAAFAELFKLHADVFGLLNDNLAIKEEK